MRMFKISSTDKNGAPNDFSQMLVDPILLIYHIIAKIKRKLSLRSRYALDTVFLDFTVSRVEKTLQKREDNSDFIAEIKKTFARAYSIPISGVGKTVQKAKPVLISLQISRKADCRVKKTFQESILISSQKSRKTVSRAYSVFISGVEITLQK